MIFKKLMMLMAPEDEGGTGDKKVEGDTKTEKPPEKSITGEVDAPEKSIIDADGKADGKTTKAEADKGGTDLKLKLPEGMDEKAAEPYTAIFKKHGLKAEAAQEIFDLAQKQIGDSRGAFEETAKSNWSKVLDQWLDEAHKDSEIGGDKFKPTVALADKFVQRFGGAEFADVLIKSGLGRNAVVLKALAKAGKMITEDKIDGTTGSKGGGKGDQLSKKERLKRDYPNSPGMWEHLPD